MDIKSQRFRKLGMCKKHFNEDSGALLVHRSEHPAHDDNISAEKPTSLVHASFPVFALVTLAASPNL